MELSGECRIQATRDIVWEALRNPSILQKCIPGCEHIAQLTDTEFEAIVRLSVGPVKARFKGNVILTELNPPRGYKISGEGKGGVAGFVRGSANVSLQDDSHASTLLIYQVQAAVGGKLAQLGNRLILSTAKRLSDQFFDKLRAELTPECVEAPSE